MRTKPGVPTHRPLGPDHDGVGLAGERAFAERYGYLPDGNAWRQGDGVADFRTLHGTVDVKTYRKPGHLLVETGKERADIYVLARYSDATAQATLLGWAVKIEVEAAPVSDVGGMGVQSHAIPADDLHPLAQLDAMFGAWCVGCGDRVIGPTTAPRKFLEARPKPADYVIVCQACVADGWRLA